MVLLGSSLVHNFYLLRTFVTWRNEVQAFKICPLGHLYFNKVCSCKIYSRAFVKRLP